MYPLPVRVKVPPVLLRGVGRDKVGEKEVLLLTFTYVGLQQASGGAGSNTQPSSAQ